MLAALAVAAVFVAGIERMIADLDSRFLVSIQNTYKCEATIALTLALLLLLLLVVTTTVTLALAALALVILVVALAVATLCVTALAIATAAAILRELATSILLLLVLRIAAAAAVLLTRLERGCTWSEGSAWVEGRGARSERLWLLLLVVEVHLLGLPRQVVVLGRRVVFPRVEVRHGGQYVDVVGANSWCGEVVEGP